jgi:integrase
LASLPRYEGSEYVFPAATGEGQYVGLPKVWYRIRKSAGLSDVRLHDLRHSFARFGVAGGDSLPVIGAILGHSDAATTQRYAHLADHVNRAAANRISGRIAAAMEGKTADVVELSRKA